jgi:hypothetical protein
MINLKGKYVHTDDKEVLELFLDECEKQGFNWVYGEAPRGFKPDGKYVVVSDGLIGQADNKDPYKNRGYQRLTLDDFKPTPWKPAVGEPFIDGYGNSHVCRGFTSAGLIIGERTDAGSLEMFHDYQIGSIDLKRKKAIDAAIKATQGKSHPIDIIEALYDAGLLHE